MRGACLVYRCTADERLYDVMREAALGLLDCAGPDGRMHTSDDITN